MRSQAIRSDWDPNELPSERTKKIDDPLIYEQLARILLAHYADMARALRGELLDPEAG